MFLKKINKFFFYLILILVTAPSQIPTNVQLTPMFGTDQNQINRLTWMGQVPGRSELFLAAQQFNGSDEGVITLFERQAGGSFNSTEFYRFPIGARKEGNGYSEEGLLTMAFHPDFINNRKYYMYYNPSTGGTRVALEERLATSDFKSDAGQGTEIISFDKDAPVHNGGTLTFGNDGYLYIGLGDNADGNSAQSNELYGKILRIDVDNPSGGLNYGIPSDNPYVNGGSFDGSVFAHGVRNPWRGSVDPITGNLWVADVSEYGSEEVNIIGSGENMGWPSNSGSSCGSGTCPVHTLETSDGGCITGGFVFRGNSSSPFYGTYIFGDFTSRRVWALPYDESTGQAGTKIEIATSPQRISSFGLGNLGEIYVVGYEGTIYLLDHPELKSDGNTDISTHGTKSGKIFIKTYDGINQFNSHDFPDVVSLKIYSLNGKLIHHLKRKDDLIKGFFLKGLHIVKTIGHNNISSLINF